MADFFFLAVLLLWSRFCGVSTHSLDGSGEIDFTTSLPASTLNFSSIPSPKRIHKGSGLGRSRNGSAPVPPPPPLWFEDEKCSRPAPSGCSPIGDQTCFGLKLSNSQVEAANREFLHEKLERLAKFSGLPHCWDALRDVLCAVYMPNCTEVKDTTRVKLASMEMCLKALETCSFLKLHHLWPAELGNCTNSSTFAPKCQKYEVPIKWAQQEQKCVEPLTNSDFRDGWIFGIERCALNCTSPWLTESQHSQVRRAAKVVVVIILAICFVTALALLRGSMAKSYPISLRPLFWVFFFYVVICVSWLTQFFLTDKSLICRKDGSLKFNEPNDSDSHSCSIQFFFLYYSVMAIPCWFVVFTYCQFLSFTEQPTVAHKEISRHRSYFHLFAWAFPLVLFVAIVAMSQIDADGVSGVCFVGYKNPNFFVGFVFAPIMVNWALSFSLIVYALMKRKRIDHAAKVTLVINDMSESRCGSLSVKLIGLYFGLFLVFTASVVIHMRNYFTLEARNSDLLNYIICHLSGKAQCELANRADLHLVQLDIFLLFLPAVLSAMFVWTNGLGTVLKTECVRVRTMCGSRKTQLHSGRPNGILTHMEGSRQNTENYEMSAGSNYNSRRRSLNSSMESCLLAELAGAKPVLSGEGGDSESDSRSKRREIIQRLSRSQRKSSASRVEDKLRSHWYRLAQRSMTSLNSGRTPSSLRSGPLPSEILVPSLPDLAYPEPMRYPGMMDPRMFQAYQGGYMPPYMFNPWMYFSTMQNAASAAGGFMPPGMFPPFYQSPATSGTPGQAEHPNASTTTTSTSVGDGVKSDGNGEKQNAESKTPTTSAMGPPPYGGMFYYPYGPMMNPWGFPPMGNFPQPIPTTSAMANTNNSTEMKQSESRQKTNTSGLSGNSKKSEMVKKTANTETQAKSTESASVVGANKSTPVEKSDNDSDGEGSDDEEISLDDGDDSSVDEGEAEFIAAQMRLYQQVKSNSGAETQPLLDEASGDYEGPTGSVRSLPPS